jgi:hypothetical protein
MGNIVPPPSTGVPAVQDREGKFMDFTSIWRKWFIDLAQIINDSGGTGGSVPSSRSIFTEAPLHGGGDLAQDRTITFDDQPANLVLAGPAAGPVSALPTFRVLVYQDFPGISVTIILAKITPLGNNGELTFSNGILTAYVDPT